MSDSVKMVELPLEDGKDKKSVRAGLRAAFPNYRVASILRDDENERWLARLVEQDGRVHHKLADDKDAPFPLKELGPDGGDDEGDGEEPKDDASDEDSDEEPKDDEDMAEDGPDEEEPKDDKGELKDLLKQLKKLLPAMEKVVGPLDEDEGHDLHDMPEDVGPVPGGPPPGGPMGGPPGAPPGGPPAGLPGPPRRPGVPGGRPKPGAPPGVPAFSAAKKLALQRTADVTADEAKAELLQAHPDYEITDFQESNGLFKAILEPKATK